MSDHVDNSHLYWVYIEDLDKSEIIDKSGPYRRMIGVDFVMKSKVKYLAQKLGKSPDRLKASYEEDESTRNTSPAGT